jgi:hypothetical protein
LTSNTCTRFISEGHVDEGRAVAAGAGQDRLGVGDGGLAEAPLGLDDEREQAHVTRGRDAGHLLVRQRPRDRGGDPLLVVERLVPGGVGVLGPRRPVPPGHGLDDHQPDVLCPRLGHQRLVVGPVGRVAVQHRVQRREHRVEPEPPQGLAVGRRRPVPMPGDPDRARQPLLPGPDRRLQRPARPGHAVQLGRVADRVELDEVDPVGPEPLQAPVDLRPGALAVAPFGLGGEEDALANPRHPGPEPQLRVAVAGRHVEVVDAGVQGELDRAVGGRLVDRGERGPAVDEDGAHVAETAQPSLLHDATLP